MAAVTFPPNPAIGDTVTDPVTGSVWTWDGYKWTFTPGSGGGGGGGGTVDPADLISSESGNTLILGNDDLLYVPTPGPPVGPLNGPIVGVTNGSNAAAGMVGEYMQSINQNNGGNGGATNAWVTPAVLILTAGDWDIFSSVQFNGNSAAPITQFTDVALWMGTTTGAPVPSPVAMPDRYATLANLGGRSLITLNSPTWRQNLTATTTINLNIQATYTTGGQYGCSFILRARRMR